MSRSAAARLSILTVAILVALAGRAVAEERDLDVEADGATLHVHEVGDPHASETLIAVHGGPGLTHEYLLPLARLAKPGRRVVFYDQRGSGASPRPASGDYRLAAQVADLDAVRRAVGAARIVPVGHSWGTVIALAYAFDHPDRVSRIVLVGMGAPTAARDRRAFAAAFRARRAALQRAGIIPRKRPPPAGDDCMARFDAILPAHFADPRHPGARHLPGSYHCDVARAALRGAGDWDFRRDLQALDLPVLLVIGDADANYAGCLETAALLPPARVVRGVLRGCGHFPFIECPEPFFAMVERFLR